MINSVARFALAFAPAVMSACAAPASTPSPSSSAFAVESPPVVPLGSKSGCAKLESQLAQLARAADPAAFAASAQLDLRNGAVLVVVELQSGASLDDLHGMTIEQRSGDLLQARVPVARLCELASDVKVRQVRRPAQAVPQ